MGETTKRREKKILHLKSEIKYARHYKYNVKPGPLNNYVYIQMKVNSNHSH